MSSKKSQREGQELKTKKVEGAAGTGVLTDMSCAGIAGGGTNQRGNPPGRRNTSSKQKEQKMPTDCEAAASVYKKEDHQGQNKKGREERQTGTWCHRRASSWSGAPRMLEDKPQGKQPMGSSQDVRHGLGPQGCGPPLNEVSGQHPQRGRPGSLLTSEIQRQTQPYVGRAGAQSSGVGSLDGVEMTTSAPQTLPEDVECDAVVPMVRVRLVTSLRVPSYQSVLAEVQVDPDYTHSGPLVLQYRTDAEESLGIRAEDALIHLSQDHVGQVLL